MKSRTDLLIRVSELYYEQDLSQHEIAKLLGISRPTVSRLLDEAKETGIVEIKVNSPIRKDPALSLRLRDRLHLKDAIVVNGSYDYCKALRRCCEAALHFTNTTLQNNMTVGICWGAATRFLCDLMEEHPYDQPYYNVNVVQMVGCLGSGNPNVDGLELALRMSKSLGGTYSNIYAPAFVSNAQVQSYLVKEPQIEATLRKAEHLDIILTSVGSLDSGTSLHKAGFYTDETLADLVGRGAVGHLLARPFDADGREVPAADLFPVGAQLSTLANATWSVAVNASEDKAEGLLAAVRSGYVNTIVVDQPLARKLLALAG